MTRRIAFIASLLLMAALPAQAQTPAPAHPHPRHPAGHVRPDSAHHSAMHAMLHGNWTGTLHSPHGSPGAMSLSVMHDSLQGARLKVTADAAVRAGAASGLAIDGTKLAWTQHLAGGECKASAVLNAPTPQASETMEGKLVCASGEMTFVLRKGNE